MSVFELFVGVLGLCVGDNQSFGDRVVAAVHVTNVNPTVVSSNLRGTVKLQVDKLLLKILFLCQS